MNINGEKEIHYGALTVNWLTTNPGTEFERLHLDKGTAVLTFQDLKFAPWLSCTLCFCIPQHARGSLELCNTTAELNLGHREWR